MEIQGSAGDVDSQSDERSLFSSDATASPAAQESGTPQSGRRKREKRYRLKKILDTSKVEQLIRLIGFTLDDFEEHKPKKARASDAPKAPVNMSSFFVFWNIYPKRDIQGAAMKAWKELQPDGETFEMILRDVKRRTDSWEWKKDGGKYIPYAHSYLNGKRWLDEGVVNQNIIKRSTVV